MVCSLFTQLGSASIFHIHLRRWITAFYSVAVAQNLMTTGLLIFQIWRCERELSNVLNASNRSGLFPIMRIIIESAAIYAMFQVIVLVLYTLNQNAQFIVLETSTPMAVCLRHPDY